MGIDCWLSLESSISFSFILSDDSFFFYLADYFCQTALVTFVRFAKTFYYITPTTNTSIGFAVLVGKKYPYGGKINSL
jgi:hypothetical protein